MSPNFIWLWPHYQHNIIWKQKFHINAFKYLFFTNRQRPTTHGYLIILFSIPQIPQRTWSIPSIMCSPVLFLSYNMHPLNAFNICTTYDNSYSFTRGYPIQTWHKYSWIHWKDSNPYFLIICFFLCHNPLGYQWNTCIQIIIIYISSKI